MASVNLSEAAKLAMKSRTTLWKYVKAGKLSVTRDSKGKPFVDTSELIRVFGPIKLQPVKDDKKSEHKLTQDENETIQLLKEIKEAIQSLTLALVRNDFQLPNTDKEIIDKAGRLVGDICESKALRPEDDPDWPKELNTIADVKLRNDIRAKYFS